MSLQLLVGPGGRQALPGVRSPLRRCRIHLSVTWLQDLHNWQCGQILQVVGFAWWEAQANIFWAHIWRQLCLCKLSIICQQRAVHTQTWELYSLVWASFHVYFNHSFFIHHWHIWNFTVTANYFTLRTKWFCEKMFSFISPHLAQWPGLSFGRTRFYCGNAQLDTNFPVNAVNTIFCLDFNRQLNDLQFHPSGYAFATGSEDKTSRMFDIRSDQNVATYCPPNSTSGFTSCGLSFSGRYVLCGSDDSSVHIWDTLKNQHNGNDTNYEERKTLLRQDQSRIM